MTLQPCSIVIIRTKEDFPPLSCGGKFENIMETICKYFNCSEMQIRSKGKKEPFLFARHIAITLMYANCKSLSTTYIAKYFGRHHSTIIHSVIEVSEKLELPHSDPIKEYYLDIVKLLPFQANPIERRFNPFIPQN